MIFRLKNNLGFERCIYIILSIYIFFSYLLPASFTYAILVLVVILIILNIKINNIGITNGTLPLVLLILIFLSIGSISSLFSIFPETSFKICILRTILLMIGVLLSIQGTSYKNLKYLFVLSIIHPIFTLFSYFHSEFFVNKILIYFPQDIAAEILRFMSSNKYAGITNQIGVNAVFISISIALVFTCLIGRDSKNKIKKIALLAILWFALILTGKRGSLVASMLATLFILLVCLIFKNKKSLHKILIRMAAFLTISFVMILVLLIIVPSLWEQVNRYLGQRGTDITSGRTTLYMYALNLFKQKPLFGWGVGVFSRLYGTGVHSLYLQLLAEHGVIGFINYLVIMIINFVMASKELEISYYFRRKNHLASLMFSVYFQIYFIIYAAFANPLNDGFVLMTYMIAISIPYTMSFHNIRNSNQRKHFILGVKNNYE